MSLKISEIKTAAGNGYRALKGNTLSEAYYTAAGLTGLNPEIVTKMIASICNNAGGASHDGLALNVACMIWYEDVKLPISRKFFLEIVAADMRVK